MNMPEDRRHDAVEDSCYVTVEPCRKQFGIGPFGHLAEVVLIAGV